MISQCIPLLHISTYVFLILEEKKIKTLILSLIPEVKCRVRRPCGIQESQGGEWARREGEKGEILQQASVNR